MTVFATVGGLASAGLLGWAGIHHVRDRSGLRSALDVHGLVPTRLSQYLAPAVIIGELLTASLALAGIISSPSRVLGGFAVAAVYVLFALYASLVLVRGRDTAPCGCSPGDDPLNWWVASRNIVLAAGAAAWASSSHLPGPGVDVGWILVVGSAAATFATLLFQLPATRDDRIYQAKPSDDLRVVGVTGS